MVYEKNEFENCLLKYSMSTLMSTWLVFFVEVAVQGVMTHREKLFHDDWLRDCEFIRNLRANSVIQGKLQISKAKICNSF